MENFFYFRKVICILIQLYVEFYSGILLFDVASINSYSIFYFLCFPHFFQKLQYQELLLRA